MKLFVTVDGAQQGPHSVEEIRLLLSSGKLSMGDFAWYEGRAEWTRIHDMPELVSAVLPPRPDCQAAPPPLTVKSGSLPPKDATSANRSVNDPTAKRKTAAGWNRELWPDPTVAQLERRKDFWGKLIVIGLLTSLLLLGIGWLVEGKQKEELVPGLPIERNYGRSPYAWIFRFVSDGPFGFCGAITLAVTMALGVASHSVNSQLEKARKKESSRNTE